MTREASMTPQCRARREKRECGSYAQRGLAASKAAKSVGKGRGAPHRASVAGFSAEVRYAAGVDEGMVAIGG